MIFNKSQFKFLDFFKLRFIEKKYSISTKYHYFLSPIYIYYILNKKHKTLFTKLNGILQNLILKH